MSEKCEPSYKNVNTVKSFSEQRAATVQVMNRICQNEEYLYQQCEKLNFLSPPAIRKRFNPVLVDDSKSYGYTVGSDNNIYFNNTLSHSILVDFSNMDYVDENKSNCSFESIPGTNGNVYKAVLPLNSASNLNTDCKNYDPGDGINSFWYVGYDKNKPYEIRPDWIKNHFDPEIPSICRAQTITIPSGVVNNSTKSSFLEAVTLSIQNNGLTDSDWASPLYVQLWNVESKNVPRTEWRNNQNVPIGGDDTIYVPCGTPETALATAVFNPNVTNPQNFTFVFDKPVKVSEGEHYAIVIFSPLSHWDHCPRIGGWGRNCNVLKDNGGDAFLSENNGRTWIRYGNNDDSLTWEDYKFGKLTPQDFAFQAHIRVYEDGYITNTPYYLYLTPIRDNPIKSIYLSSVCDGNETGKNYEVVFQASTDGVNWRDFPRQSPLLTFSKVDGVYPRIVFVRAKLTTNSVNDSPFVESMNLIINNELPKEMYVRTHFYNPKLSPMLGANIWGRVYAPFASVPSNAEDVDCKVEIIQENVSKEHFHIITVNELDLFVELLDSKGEKIIDASKLNGNANSHVEYLLDNPSVIKNLKKHNVYIKPYTLNNKEYLLSFEDYDANGNVKLGGLSLTNSPAYPILECLNQPYGNQKIESFGEHYDYNVDYNNDILYLERRVLDNLPTGSLSVAYNKVFIQDLTLNEVGDRFNTETGLNEQGLILDYFKEEIYVSDNELETRRIPLRVVPVDPLREVCILRGDDETVLYEDVDFTVDYASHELIFPITNVDNEEANLQLNDRIQVIYTPNIEDTGISIGYRVTRDDLNHQLQIKPNYIEYK